MNRILVTGGAGFIGSTFVRRSVLHDGRALVNLDKLTYAGNLDSLKSVEGRPEHHFVHGDICDAPLVEQLLRDFHPQAVVHFAAESHVDRSIDDPGAFIRTNVQGTFSMLEAVRRHWGGLNSTDRGDFRFLHVSTDEVYGSLGPSGAFVESTAYAPNSPYAASKAGADHLVRAYHHTYGLPTLITNCSNNYGPFQFPEKLIPLMIHNAFSGRPLPVYGDGQNVRDWLYVDDHCEAIAQVLERGRPGEVYNIGGECEQTNLDVVHAVCDAVDRICPGLAHAPCRSLITYVPDRPGHDRRYAIDSTKLRTEIGWRPRMDFARGLDSTVQWYADHPDWVERIRSGVYRGERLGVLPSRG